MNIISSRFFHLRFNDLSMLQLDLNHRTGVIARMRGVV